MESLCANVSHCLLKTFLNLILFINDMARSKAIFKSSLCMVEIDEAHTFFFSNEYIFDIEIITLTKKSLWRKKELIWIQFAWSTFDVSVALRITQHLGGGRWLLSRLPVCTLPALLVTEQDGGTLAFLRSSPGTMAPFSWDPKTFSVLLLPQHIFFLVNKIRLQKCGVIRDQRGLVCSKQSNSP